MPPIRFSTSKRRVLLTTSISLNGEIINPYFYYAKKRLVYIAITSPSNCQALFYLKCTKANTCLLCDVRLVSLNKYIFLYRYIRRCVRYSLLVLWLSCLRVLDLIHCLKIRG